MLKFEPPTVPTAHRRFARGRWVWLAPLALLVAAAAWFSTPHETSTPIGGAALPQPVALTLPSPAEWEAITDNTPFRDAETPLWFAVWSELQKLTDKQTPASSGEATYVQLVNQADVYRGKVVTVRGWVLRSEVVTPGENELGIEQLHRVIMKPAGGGEWPLIVYALDAPEDVGEPFELAVNAVFFKNLSYRHEGGVGLAPVLLTSRIAGPPPQMATVKKEPPLSPLGVVLLAAAGAAALVAYAWRRGGRVVINPLLFLLILPLNCEGAPTATELLELLGWKSVELANATNEELAPLAIRLKRFSNEELAEVGGDFQRVVGKVTAMKPFAVGEVTSAAIAVIKESGEECILITTMPPKQWSELSPLSEPLEFIGLRIEGGDGLRYVAPRVAWRPTEMKLPTVNFGESLLGAAGVNVAELETPVDRRPLERADRASFYELLAAMRTQSTAKLVEIARGRISEFAAEFSGPNAPMERRRLTKLVDGAAVDGAYSVAPLFLAPQDLRGELFTFDAVVRRAVRIEVASAADTHGVTHYYELEAYPADSQNLPLVFCVPEIPAGFATGDDIAQPARLAGFFYKQWRYTPRRAPTDDQTRQFAPLLIGPKPQILETPTPAMSPLTPVIAGGMLLFLALLAAFLWRTHREDRRS